MISYNRHSVQRPWIITIGRDTLNKTNEQFVAFCKNQTGMTDLVYIQEVLVSLRRLEYLQIYFFNENKLEITRLINHFDSLVQQRVNPDPVINNPDPPTASSRMYLGSYLGHHRWAGDPSWLDQVD